MDERDDKRPGSHQGNSDLGSDFIAFGADSPRDNSYEQRRGWRGRGYAPQLQRISGTQRSHKSFLGEDSSNSSGYHRPYRGGFHMPYSRPDGMRRGGPFRGGGGGWRGNRNQNEQRHQAPRFPSSQDISSYYHPSMTEDPWKDLETLYRVPSDEAKVSSSQFEPPDTSEENKVMNDSDSDQSLDSEPSD